MTVVEPLRTFTTDMNHKVASLLYFAQVAPVKLEQQSRILAMKI
jgi:hypothetical protein